MYHVPKQDNLKRYDSKGVDGTKAASIRSPISPTTADDNSKCDTQPLPAIANDESDANLDLEVPETLQSPVTKVTPSTLTPQAVVSASDDAVASGTIKTLRSPGTPKTSGSATESESPSPIGRKYIVSLNVLRSNALARLPIDFFFLLLL
jgi:hypothetical protein